MDFVVLRIVCLWKQRQERKKKGIFLDFLYFIEKGEGNRYSLQFSTKNSGCPKFCDQSKQREPLFGRLWNSDLFIGWFCDTYQPYLHGKEAYLRGTYGTTLPLTHRNKHLKQHHRGDGLFLFSPHTQQDKQTDKEPRADRHPVPQQHQHQTTGEDLFGSYRFCLYLFIQDKKKKLRPCRTQGNFKVSEGIFFFQSITSRIFFWIFFCIFCYYFLSVAKAGLFVPSYRFLPSLFDQSIHRHGT